MMNFAKRVARYVRRRTIGLPPPPMRQYPFWEKMAQHPYLRPQYLWGTLCAAQLGSALGYERISVLELGVAGGNGLLELEQIAAEVETAFAIKIDVYGFDTGTGLTKPLDHRDLPQMWEEGFYSMDIAALRKRLSRAELVLGPVGETMAQFMQRAPAPVGFVSFDMDMYSSTMDGFRLFQGHQDLLLPRVTCYFDDLIGFSHGDFNGERLAIADFNKSSEYRKISQIYGLRYVLVLDQWWTQQMYMLHAFDHSRYKDFDGTNRLRELPLVPENR